MSNTIDDVVKATPLSILVRRRCRIRINSNVKVTVGSTSDVDSKDASGNVTRAVESGRHMVRRTIARLSNEKSWTQYKIEKYAKRLFLQQKLTMGTVNKIILPKLEQTLTGLTTSISINLADKVTNFNDDGVVDRQGTGLIHLRIEPFRKSYRNEIRGDYDEDEEAYEFETAYQNLKLQATSTVIHEATHRFANTVDYCYFDSTNKLRPKTPFTDVELALVNADSYAWFVCKVGRKEG
jgi:hypothetical protein